MNTAQKGDISEQATILFALKKGWGVSKPVGNNLPYDLIFDVDGVLIKIQVKTAWFDRKSKNYVLDNRRTKTNRRQMIRASYCENDFDFAIAYIEDLNVFYVFPVSVFIGYAGQISLVEAEKRQRKPRSVNYRETWELIETWASYKETYKRLLLKFGETLNEGDPEPSPKGKV